MATKATNIVTVGKGVLYTTKKDGDRGGFNTLNDAIAKVFRCCGPDCCENVYRWIDKKDKTCYVQYVFCGELVFELESVYKEKKKAGFFKAVIIKEEPVKEKAEKASKKKKK